MSGSLAAIVLAGGLVAQTSLRAQETRSSTRLTTEHYLDWERVADAQIAPDGSRIVYTRQYVNQIEDKWESELWIVNADGSQNRFFVKGSAARWAPDGKRIVYLAEGEPKGTQLFVRWVDAVGPPTPITHVTETPRSARWSPDGTSIAFSMFVPQKGTLKIDMPEEPKGAKWTPAPRMVQSLHYRQDQIGFLEDGYTHLFVVAADGGTPRQLTNGKWNVGSGELRMGAAIDWTLDSKTIVFNAERNPDFDLKYQSAQLYAQDVVRVNLRQPGPSVKLTDVNADVLAGKQLAKTEEIWYTSTGNTRVQGWIVKPPSFDAAKKYPLILEIHGGPFSMYTVAFNYMWQNFAANNFVVLYTNPRGSTGYGGAFSNGIDHNYPGPDYDDLMAGVDAVVAKGYVDQTRMYVSGCSGGGGLSSWVVGHTDRFAAAAGRCRVIDWVGMAGRTGGPIFI